MLRFPEGSEAKMKVLIIGCGGQGAFADAPGSGNDHKVISFAKAFKERNAELIFLDIDVMKSRQAAEVWDGEYIDNYDMPLLDIPKVDIIVIATPDSTHYEWLLKIAFLDVKLVICEKPLCETLEQNIEIVELYDDLKIPLMVDFTRRFIPKYRFMKSDFKKGLLGKFIYGRCVFNRGNLHSGSHAIDLFNWFLEGDFKNVELIESEITEYRVWDLLMVFEKFAFTERRIGNMPVPYYFDYHTQYVVENAIAFLQGRQPLFSLGKYSIEGAEKLCLIRENKKQ